MLANGYYWAYYKTAEEECSYEIVRVTGYTVSTCDEYNMYDSIDNYTGWIGPLEIPKK